MNSFTKVWCTLNIYLFLMSQTLISQTEIDKTLNPYTLKSENLEMC